MARHEIVALSPGIWVELTNADVTEVSFQNLSGFVIEVEATAGTAPDEDAKGFIFQPQDGAASIKLADLFSGVSSPKRLWARSLMIGKVKVSHA